MRRILALLLFLTSLALATTLDYDPKIKLPAGAQLLKMSDCPVPKGFWEPLASKGWMSECLLARGDSKVLAMALALALRQAGYSLDSHEEHGLSGSGRFILEQWRAAERRLFVQYFLFYQSDTAVYLLSHPPR